MKSYHTYQYEVRSGRELITATDNPKTAYHHATNTPGFVTVFDNDNKYPVVCRVNNGIVQVIQPAFKSLL